MSVAGPWLGSLYEFNIPEESIEMIWEQLLSYLISLDTKANRLGGEWIEQKQLLENLFYLFFKLGRKLIEVRDCVELPQQCRCYHKIFD